MQSISRPAIVATSSNHFIVLFRPSSSMALLLLTSFFCKNKMLNSKFKFKNLIWCLHLHLSHGKSHLFLQDHSKVSHRWHKHSFLRKNFKSTLFSRTFNLLLCIRSIYLRGIYLTLVKKTTEWNKNSNLYKADIQNLVGIQLHKGIRAKFGCMSRAVWSRITSQNKRLV